MSSLSSKFPKFGGYIPPAASDTKKKKRKKKMMDLYKKSKK